MGKLLALAVFSGLIGLASETYALPPTQGFFSTGYQGQQGSYVGFGNGGMSAGRSGYRTPMGSSLRPTIGVFSVGFQAQYAAAVRMRNQQLNALRIQKQMHQQQQQQKRAEAKKKIQERNQNQSQKSSLARR